MSDSCRCCVRPAPTRCCCWRRCIRASAWPASCDSRSRPGLEPLVEAHSAEGAGGGARDRSPASSASTTATSRRSRWTRARASACAPQVPDDRIVVAESGVHDAATVRRWRALGFDAALVGEDLMRSGSDAARGRGAGGRRWWVPVRCPGPASIRRVDGRAPFVKICGITEPAGLDAAIAAGADAIGLNFVPGTPRALDEAEAAALVALRSRC